MPKGGAKAKEPASGAKRARAAPPASSAGDTPLFCFRYAQVKCDPRWAFQPSADHAAELFGFIRQMAQCTWAEIDSMRTGNKDRHKKHHDQDVETPPLDRQAVKDLEKAKLGEQFGDTMFRFRLGGEKRLWGFRKDGVFHVVWWDPGHKVHPTERN